MRRKVLYFLAIFFLLIAGSVHHSPVTASNVSSVTVTGDIVNVRAQPGTSYAVITQVRQGETYVVRSDQNGWYEIKLPTGETGWIADWLVEKQSTKTSSGSEEKKGTISVNHLNVRSGPSTSEAVVGKLHKGDTVHIIEENNEWSRIRFQNSDAWISAAYIEAERSNSSSTPVHSQSEFSYVQISQNETNIRQEPNRSSPIVKTAQANEKYKVIAKSGDWYHIEISAGKNGYVASWVVTGIIENAVPANSNSISKKGLEGKTIVLDAGHGGRDQGAKGAMGTLEKELTLDTAKLIAKKLESAGANVAFTRTNDVYIGLQKRTAIASALKADAFISLHYDSIKDNKINGHTSYFYHGYEQNLAKTLHKHVTHAVKIKDRGVRRGDYYVLRENSQPAVLLELGYMSNASEEKIIRTASYRETVANAVYEGLKEYFN